MSPFWAVAVVIGIVPPTAPRRPPAGAVCEASCFPKTQMNAIANTASSRIQTRIRIPPRPPFAARKGVCSGLSPAEGGALLSAVNRNLLLLHLNRPHCNVPERHLKYGDFPCWTAENRQA